MNTSKTRNGVVVVLAVLLPSAAYAQGAAAIQQKLRSEYQLTKVTDDQTDIVTAGAVMILQKDKVMMSAGSGCSNIYKDGKISATGGCKVSNKLKAFHITQDDADATRNFVTGEKFWLTKIEIKDSGKDHGIVLGFFSDVIDDDRFKGTVLIPLGASMPTPEEAVKLVAEVISPAPADDANQAAQAPPEQPAPRMPRRGGPMTMAPRHNAAFAAPAPAYAAPAPPPAAPTPLDIPAPAAADPTVVAEGQSIDQVVASMGQPLRKAKIGTKDMYYYKDLKVVFVDGKVTDVQ
jgi:hypothetical protein